MTSVKACFVPCTATHSSESVSVSDPEDSIAPDGTDVALMTRTFSRIDIELLSRVASLWTLFEWQLRREIGNIIR